MTDRGGARYAPGMAFAAHAVCLLALAADAAPGREMERVRRFEETSARLGAAREAGPELEPARNRFFQDADEAVFVREAEPVVDARPPELQAAYAPELRLAPAQPPEPPLRRGVRELASVAGGAALATGAHFILHNWTDGALTVLIAAALAVFFSEGLIATLVQGRRRFVGFYQHSHDITLRTIQGRPKNVRRNEGGDRWDVFEPGDVTPWERWGLRALGASLALAWFF